MKTFNRELLGATLCASLWMATLAAHADTTTTHPVTSVSTRIFRITEPKKQKDAYSVFSTSDGRVYALEQNQSGLIARIRAAAEKNEAVSLKIVDDTIVAVEPLTGAEARRYSDDLSGMTREQISAELDAEQGELGVRFASENAVAEGDPTPPPAAMPAAYNEFLADDYRPTILGSVAEAQELFRSLRDVDHEGTQCHERGMYWAYNMYHQRSIQSMKVMMFYTEKLRNTFIRHRPVIADKPYKWWYHTAPYVFVRDRVGGKEVIQEMVLDRVFLPQAVTIDEWTRHFIVDETLNYVGDYRHMMPDLTVGDAYKCRVMKNYREYRNQLAWYAYNENKYEDYIDRAKSKYSEIQRRIEAHDNPNEPWCMVRKFPMYYMQPASVQQMDCDPDLDYAEGATTKMIVINGKKVPKAPCIPYRRRSFNEKWVINDILTAFDEVGTSGEYKWIKRRLGRD